MKFKILITIFFFISSCASNITKIDNKTAYSAKGFAYIYDDSDYENKVINKKLDNSKMFISVNRLSLNTLVKLINPSNNESISLNNTKKIQYPEIYNILITKPVAEKLKLNPELPFLEILEIKKNKSFIAKKAKIFQEERKISTNAPVTSVEISNISKNKEIKKNKRNNSIYILIATFYSNETAQLLKKRIIKELPKYDNTKLKIRKKTNNKIDLISGPYKTINLMKNDYILIKNFGFEELDIILND